ncbi:MAG: hypothetical protein Q9173_006727 [Seirophora scorigena]
MESRDEEDDDLESDEGEWRFAEDDLVSEESSDDEKEPGPILNKHLLEETSVAPTLPRRPPYMQSVYAGIEGAIAWQEYRKALGHYHEWQRRQRKRDRALRRLRRGLWHSIVKHKEKRIRGVMEKRRERTKNRRTVEIKVPRDPDYQGVERNVNRWRQRRLWQQIKRAVPGIVALKERITLEMEFIGSSRPYTYGKDAKFEIRWMFAPLASPLCFVSPGCMHRNYHARVLDDLWQRLSRDLQATAKQFIKGDDENPDKNDDEDPDKNHDEDPDKNIAQKTGRTGPTQPSFGEAEKREASCGERPWLDIKLPSLGSSEGTDNALR